MEYTATHPTQPSRLHWLWPLALLAIAAAVRLPGIERPLTGNFATKNVVYAMIARNWAEGRAGLLEPTLDCLVGGHRSLHLLEFPVSAYLSGLLWKGLGGSLDVWGRLTALGFTLGSVALLYVLVARWHGKAAAVIAGLVLALSPVSILYGRSFMLEASLVFFMVATIWAWDRWLGVGRWPWLAVSGVALSLAFLTKIYVLVLLAPMVAMAVRGPRCTWPTLRIGAISALLVIVAALPAAAWYRYAAVTAGPGSPAADRVYYSVRASVEAHRPPHPLLGSARFYGHMASDLIGPVLTPLGFALVLAGLLNPACRRHLAWLAGSLVLIVLLPRKFYEMNYYWMAVLPVLAVVGGLGWQLVQDRLRPGRAAMVGTLLLSILLAARYAAGPVLKTPDEDRGVVAAGLAIRGLTATEEPVVTTHGSTIDLLYYCQRPGWAIERPTPAVLEDCRRQGARTLAVAGAEPLQAPQWSGIDSAPLARGPGYAVYRILPR